MLSAAVPPPNAELRFFLPPMLDSTGRSGSGAVNLGPATTTATETAGGRSATTQMTTTYTGTVQGSTVRLEIKRDAHTVVTDVASGASVLDATTHYTVDGQINVCPSAAGIVDASVHNAIDWDLKTTAGAGGRVGSHATAKLTSASVFRGQVDDAATLGAVSQDYSHDAEWRRTASAEGGPEASREGAYGINESGIKVGVPASHEYSTSLGDHSDATGTAHMSGDATQADVNTTALSAAEDYTTIDESYVAAQRLWRHGRCVMVTVPEYDAETALDPSSEGFVAHTEEVDKGSTTTFDANLKHRFGGTVAASIGAELVSGKESLEPGSLPQPPGTLTYEAPDEDGKDAQVRLESTSKQGIGILVLAFHTGAKKLKVTIDGKLTSSGYGVKFVTTVSVPKVVLSKLDDGTYLGSGPLTAKVSIAGLCSTPITETGTIKLQATRQVVEDQSLPRSWKVTWDESGKVTTSGKCLGRDIGSLMQVGPAGYTGMFMTVLGDLEFNEDGGTKQVKRSMAFGSSQNTIDATVKAEIVSESKP